MADLETWRAVAQAMVEHTGCDTCSKDANHVWRLAGCFNYPNKSKVDKGRTPEPQQVKLIHEGDAVEFNDLKAAYGTSIAPKVEKRAAADTAKPLDTFAWLDDDSVEEDDVRASLEKIDTDLPYAAWVKILMALHDAGFDHLAHQWSKKSSRYDAAETQAKLDSFKKNDGKLISLKTVHGMWKEYPAKALPSDDDIWDDEWEAPEPFTQVIYPDLPSQEDMPPCVWEIVNYAAEQAGTNTAFSFTSVLATLAGLLRGKCYVARSDGSIRNLVTVFTINAALSGEGKSATRGYIDAPLKRILEEMKERFIQEHSLWSSKRRVNDKWLATLEKDLAKDEREHTQAEIQRLNEIDEHYKIQPQKGLSLFSQATPEALVEKCSMDGFVLLATDEGSSIRAIALKLHSPDEYFSQIIIIPSGFKPSIFNANFG